MGKEKNFRKFQEEWGGKPMRQPMGFNGSAIWAIVFVLIVGVVWIENRFGANIAGAALLGVFGVLIFLVGQLVNIASNQASGAQRVEELRANAVVERERVKGENIVNKFELQQQAKLFGAMLSMAIKTARQPQSTTAEPEAIEVDFWGEDEAAEQQPAIRELY